MIFLCMFEKKSTVSKILDMENAVCVAMIFLWFVKLQSVLNQINSIELFQLSTPITRQQIEIFLNRFLIHKDNTVLLYADSLC